MKFQKRNEFLTSLNDFEINLLPFLSRLNQAINVNHLTCRPNIIKPRLFKLS